MIYPSCLFSYDKTKQNNDRRVPMSIKWPVENQLLVCNQMSKRLVKMGHNILFFLISKKGHNILQSLLIHNEQAKLEHYKGWTEEDPRKLTHQKEQVTRKWREKVVNKDLIIQLPDNKGVQGTLQRKITRCWRSKWPHYSNLNNQHYNIKITTNKGIMNQSTLQQL